MGPRLEASEGPDLGVPQDRRVRATLGLQCVPQTLRHHPRGHTRQPVTRVCGVRGILSLSFRETTQGDP